MDTCLIPCMRAPHTTDVNIRYVLLVQVHVYAGIHTCTCHMYMYVYVRCMYNAIMHVSLYIMLAVVPAVVWTGLCSLRDHHLSPAETSREEHHSINTVLTCMLNITSYLGELGRQSFLGFASPFPQFLF